MNTKAMNAVGNSMKTVKSVVGDIGLPSPNQTARYGIIAAIVIVFLIAAVSILNWLLKTYWRDKKSVKQQQTNQVVSLNESISSFLKGKRTLVRDTTSADQKALVNYAPLTVLQPGFVGPLRNGVYNTRDGTISALKVGARCFVLPIDYYDDSSLPEDLFYGANKPVMLMRDEGDNIRSLNAGRIQDVAQAIADIAFSNQIPVTTDPIIVVLYFKRTPPAQTKEYLRFLSQAAKELAPLRPYMLGQTPEGSYFRQGRQNELLYSPVSLFERKVLLFTNVDTTLFRTPETVGDSKYSPSDDLDYLVNLRLYKQSVDTNVGSTSVADTNTFARGIVEKVSYYTAIPADREMDTINSTKIRWTMALGSYGENPEEETVKKLLTKYGVQSIPIYMFDIQDKEKKILALWKDAYYRIKPNQIRFTRPAPIKPKEPSTKLNAQGGFLTSPKI